MRADSTLGSSVVTYRSISDRFRGGVVVVSRLLSVTLVLGAALLVAGVFGLGAGDGYRLLAGTAIVVGLIIAAFSALFVVAFRRESKRDYGLTLAPNQITLRMAHDATTRGAAREVHLPLEEIGFVEWFTPRDRESLIFHLRDGDTVEAPIWHMDRPAADAVTFLRARGIDVVRI